MIEVAVGQQDARDRRVPLGPRPEIRAGFDLRANLRRRVDQEPGLAVGADGDRLLRARPRAAARPATFTAIEAAAVPLREATTRGGTENAYLQTAEPLVAVGRTVVRLALDDRIPWIAIGEIALVATDFRAHVDFNEGRGFPLHGCLSFREL